MTLLRFVISILYVFAGFSGFVAFIVFKNYPSAVLAAATGFINSISSRINFLNYKNTLQEWYSSQNLRQISNFGFWCFTLATSVLVYFSVSDIILKIPILPIEESIVITIVWAFITLKSGLLLFYFAKSYAPEDRPHLLTEEVFEEHDYEITADNEA